MQKKKIKLFFFILGFWNEHHHALNSIAVVQTYHLFFFFFFSVYSICVSVMLFGFCSCEPPATTAATPEPPHIMAIQVSPEGFF